MIRRDVEGPIQEAIVNYLRTVLPPPCIVHHNKNEIKKRGKAIQIELAIAKRRGVVTGFPDITVLMYASMGVLFFEVKAPGNYPTKDQKAVHADLEALGYRVAVVRSVDDVEACLRKWHISTAHVKPL